MNAFLSLPIAYFLGSIPFGFLLVRLKTGNDIRASGSGNIGATNVLRTSGRVAGFATLLLDIAKGYVAVWIAAWLSHDDPFWMAVAALAVILGHAFSLFLKFKGGKAVASFVGAFLYLAPAAIAATAVIFVLLVAWTRHLSMGSIAGAATFPLGYWLLYMPPLPLLMAAILGSALILYRHTGNVRRLRQGTEHRFTLSRAGS
jgi:glycerol-3-phosphate acyltransferase PlsY